MGVDTLHAAGSAALIPSRVGKHETDSVLGATSPDGSTLSGVAEAAALAAAAAAEEAKSVEITEDGFNKYHEMLYGPRRTAVLFVMLLVVGFALWGFFRWRSGQRRRASTRRKGKGRAKDHIRLEESDVEAVGGRGSRTSYRDRPSGGAGAAGAGAGAGLAASSEPLETTAVFDVGEEDEFEESELETSDDSDAEGDIGRGAKTNPWRET